MPSRAASTDIPQRCACSRTTTRLRLVRPSPRDRRRRVSHFAAGGVAAVRERRADAKPGARRDAAADDHVLHARRPVAPIIGRAANGRRIGQRRTRVPVGPRPSPVRRADTTPRAGYVVGVPALVARHGQIQRRVLRDDGIDVRPVLEDATAPGAMESARRRGEARRGPAARSAAPARRFASATCRRTSGERRRAVTRRSRPSAIRTAPNTSIQVVGLRDTCDPESPSARRRRRARTATPAQPRSAAAEQSDEEQPADALMMRTPARGDPRVPSDGQVRVRAADAVSAEAALRRIPRRNRCRCSAALGDGFDGQPRGAVGACAGHRVERIGDVDDARGQRNRVAFEPVWIAVAVRTFVVQLDDRDVPARGMGCCAECAHRPLGAS